MSEPTDQAAEITLPGTGGDDTADRSAPPGLDPAVRGSEEAAEPLPQDNAEQLESALREGVGSLGPADPYAQQRREAPTEDGPGTSLN